MIAKPFNSVLLALLSLIALTIFLLYFFLRNKSQKVRRNALLISSGILVLNYIVHRIIFFNDPAMFAVYGQYGYLIRDSLPFHLCGLGIILAPIALLKKNDLLYTFCFVVSPVGALLAIIYPPIPYDVTPITDPCYCTYFLEHALIVINGLSLVTLGLFTPKIRLIGKITLLMVILSFIAHLINLGAPLLGFEDVNYFYTMDPSGSSLLELFWSWLPYPYLYLLLYIPVLVIYYFLLVGFVLLIKKFRVPSLEKNISPVASRDES